MPPETHRKFRYATTDRLGVITSAGIGTNIAEAPLRGNMRILDSYAVVYTFDGDASYYKDANGLERDITAGDMILLFPGLAHSYGPRPNERWSEFWMMFEGPVFELWEKTGILNPSQPIHHLEPIDYWLRQFRSVLGGQDSTENIPPFQTMCRLQMVLSEALLAGERGSFSREDLRWISRACVLLESQDTHNFKLSDIADSLGDSYDNFRKRFTHILGITPGRYRSKKLIERGCELMQQTDLPIKQIAYNLGFCDEFHFSHRFKQITGRSPRAFRRSLPGATTMPGFL